VNTSQILNNLASSVTALDEDEEASLTVFGAGGEGAEQLE